MTRLSRLVTAFVLTVSLLGAFVAPASAQDHSGHDMAACGTATPDGHSGHDMSGHAHDATAVASPAATAAPTFDLAYIDMMIPHHESVIALAEVALPMLTDQRLIDMASAIVTTQGAEIETLRQMRETHFPGAAPVDPTDHAVLHSAFPSLLTWDYPMEQWGALMDAEALVSQFCGMEDPDLAFVQLVIPHHEMAILASQDALTSAQVPELVAMAEQVITAQQAEVDALEQVLAELGG
jgi:uncharacterized protein (DUF305 family)